VSAQIILLFVCIAAIVSLIGILVVAFRRGGKINLDERLSEFTQRGEDLDVDDLHPRMAGEPTTDAPLPGGDVKKKEK